MFSVYGILGLVAASNTRDPWFESSHERILFITNCNEAVLKRQKRVKKRTGMAH